ncbi:hypothetical protein ISS30_08080 [bacterium]|nr:hypothetical protein [FCB group bacterium]MBL7191642.1 hypothetical protein [bacterium]
MIFHHIVKRLIIFFGLFVLIGRAESAFELTGGGVISMSMGGAGCGWIIPSEALMSNPAVSAFLPDASLSLNHRRMFNLKELQQSALAVNMSIGKFPIVLKAFNFGDDLYRESAAGAGSALLIYHNLAVGLQAEIYHLNIKNNSSAFSYGINAGILWRINERLSWGAAASNVNLPKIGQCREKLPVSVCAGLSYHPLEWVNFCLDYYQDDMFPSEIRGGMEFLGLKNPVLRIGYSDQPASFSAGFDVDVKFFRMAYAFKSHNQLGFTHSLGLIIGLTGRRNRNEAD